MVMVFILFKIKFPRKLSTVNNLQEVFVGNFKSLSPENNKNWGYWGDGGYFWFRALDTPI